ncbi:hypothetical protein GCM10020367_64770 [Streptomyces sannanensis]|uniref:Transposase n=1 Tax=Streptomyces sannanensis TaxID=285536 RepID=A0ABP6S4E5_9ACTN
MDGQSIDEFEKDLKAWNQMSSGMCFSPPVRAVEIPEQHGGGMRMLGRNRCRTKGCVIDLDMQKFFAGIRWYLIVKVVEAHADAVWVVLCVERWLKARRQGG